MEAVKPNVIQLCVCIEVGLVAGSYKCVVSNETRDRRAGNIFHEILGFGHFGGFNVCHGIKVLKVVIFHGQSYNISF